MAGRPGPAAKNGRTLRENARSAGLERFGCRGRTSVAATLIWRRCRGRTTITTTGLPLIAETIGPAPEHSAISFFHDLAETFCQPASRFLGFFESWVQRI